MEKFLEEIFNENISKPHCTPDGKIFYITHNGVSNKEQWEKNPMKNLNLEKLTCMASLIPIIFEEMKRVESGSYGGKHIIENLIVTKGFSRGYVSNGEFILVMISLGYKYRLTSDKSPNLMFKGRFIKNIFSHNFSVLKKFKYKIELKDAHSFN